MRGSSFVPLMVLTALVVAVTAISACDEGGDGGAGPSIPFGTFSARFATADNSTVLQFVNACAFTDQPADYAYVTVVSTVGEDQLVLGFYSEGMNGLSSLEPGDFGGNGFAEPYLEFYVGDFEEELYLGLSPDDPYADEYSNQGGGTIHEIDSSHVKCTFWAEAKDGSWKLTDGQFNLSLKDSPEACGIDPLDFQ